ncbi:MAG TPA: CoB--CoM heterodisulfide reductase iron-sulfur subunit A family protein [Methanofastidiosum sp.]|mgnify:FL=1|nr:CoB--CoM heterodisulfide reductase iron-sulfur subunit A family protein [Methanofastidiosum sp.]
MDSNSSPRVGVFVCHCGSNIAGTVDVEKVAQEISKMEGVAYAGTYIYMCSDPGQKLMRETIEKEKLDRVVVAACSPTLHEKTFRTNSKNAGLNPYQCEISNIREHCSWVHEDKKKATEKAIKITKSIVEKVKNDISLTDIEVPITKKAIVIGGGVSGIQAALDIANGGYKTYLIEKDSSIGGKMAKLSETFPTLDCSQCILTPKMVEAANHPDIELMTYSEVDSVSGYVGNFKVKVKKKPTSVNWDLCTGCGDCYNKCPAKVPSEFQEGLSKRAAIYIPFPQAVPNKPVIDRENCLYYQKGICKICEKVCKIGAIDFDMKEDIVEIDAGAIVVATGYQEYPLENLTEYGGGKYPNVISGLKFERLLSASGPTGGQIVRPSDGKAVKDVVFVQCAGSRDIEEHKPYCSKICCMYTAKHAMLFKHKVHDGNAYVFYIDVRTAGKDYEEFYYRTTEEDHALYTRGKVSKIFEDGEKVVVWGVDTLTGKKVEVKADLAVLAMAIEPSAEIKELQQKLKISIDENGFLKEAHPKLRPVESMTSGIFFAGAAQGPKDIPESVSQAGAAASKVLSMFSSNMLHKEPLICEIDEDVCSGCGVCIALCPYGALEAEITTKEGKEVKRSKLNEALCQGCGTCSSACPSGAATMRNDETKNMFKMIEVILE